MFLTDPQGTPSSRELGEQPATLSGLIRLGSKLLPQGRGVYYHEGKTCAIGAAFHASRGRVPSPGGDDAFQFALDWSSRLREGGLSILSIYSRNDGGETREQIADWLEAQGY